MSSSSTNLQPITLRNSQSVRGSSTAAVSRTPRLFNLTIPRCKKPWTWYRWWVRIYPKLRKRLWRQPTHCPLDPSLLLPSAPPENIAMRKKLRKIHAPTPHLRRNWCRLPARRPGIPFVQETPAQPGSCGRPRAVRHEVGFQRRKRANNRHCAIANLDLLLLA